MHKRSWVRIHAVVRYPTYSQTLQYHSVSNFDCQCQGRSPLWAWRGPQVVLLVQYQVLFCTEMKDESEAETCKRKQRYNLINKQLHNNDSNGTMAPTTVLQFCSCAHVAYFKLSKTCSNNRLEHPAIDVLTALILPCDHVFWKRRPACYRSRSSSCQARILNHWLHGPST